MFAFGRPTALSLLAITTLAYCAAAVNFSWIQSFHNSDTVIPALISIEKYSLFYWSENRFGMLVPLLASPVRDYGWNLLLQSQMIVLAGIGTILLLDVLVLGSSDARTPRVTIAALLVLAFYKPQASLVLLLPGSPYLVGLFLLVGALYVLLRVPHGGPVRWLFAAALMLLAFWVNFSNVVMAGAAALFWPVKDRAELRNRAAVLAVIAGAAAAISIVSRQFPGTDVRELLPLVQWPASFMKVMRNVQLTIHDMLLLVVLGGAAIIEVFQLKRNKYSPAHALAIAAACQIVITSGLRWVALNGYDSRYIAGPLVVLIALALLKLIAPVARALENVAGPAVATLTCCLLAVLIVTRVFGIPSFEGARMEISRATSDIAAPSPQLGCTHIIGSYWYTWETVFNSRMRTGQQRLWAISHRSDAIRDAWTAMPPSDRRYCSVCSDTEVEHWRSQEGVGQLTKEAESNGICVFREGSK
jgi:hypothetical protein